MIVSLITGQVPVVHWFRGRRLSRLPFAAGGGALVQVRGVSPSFTGSPGAPWEDDVKLTAPMAWLAAVMMIALVPASQAKEVVPMYGGVIIDGYDYAKDIGPKGSIAYDESANKFVGAYNGLKMPAGRRAS